MSNKFVWFHNHNEKPADSARFYRELLSWKPSEGPGMTMLAVDAAPFSAVGALDGVDAGWVPFVEVDHVDRATERAIELGATVVKPRTRGPAGEYTVVRDPGGAAIALWQKA